MRFWGTKLSILVQPTPTRQCGSIGTFSNHHKVHVEYHVNYTYATSSRYDVHSGSIVTYDMRSLRPSRKEFIWTLKVRLNTIFFVYISPLDKLATLTRRLIGDYQIPVQVALSVTLHHTMRSILGLLSLFCPIMGLNYGTSWD